MWASTLHGAELLKCRARMQIVVRSSVKVLQINKLQSINLPDKPGLLSRLWLLADRFQAASDNDV